MGQEDIDIGEEKRIPPAQRSKQWQWEQVLREIWVWSMTP